MDIKRVWHMPDDYLAKAEVIRPKYVRILLDIVERYYEIEGGDPSAHIRETMRRLRSKQELHIN